jgi:5-methylcytosine-specific restriction endonuclease McrBC regulatory subunit McrC
MILRLLGTDPTSYIPQRPSAIPPFALCTYELFERFAEVLLRKRFKKIWTGYEDKNLFSRDGKFFVRPDFLIKDCKWIVDCKYKKYPESLEKAREDVYQVVAYSRHKGVLKELSDNEKDPEKMILLYPEVNSEWENWELIHKKVTKEVDNSFTIPLEIRTLYCPQKNTIIRT